MTKRKISGGTWSDDGRLARDTFLGLLKTCQKLRVSFFEYLGNRIGVDDAPNIMPLPKLIMAQKFNRPGFSPDYDFAPKIFGIVENWEHIGSKLERVCSPSVLLACTMLKAARNYQQAFRAGAVEAGSFDKTMPSVSIILIVPLA